MINITRGELEDLYRTNTNKEVCKILGITVPTLLKYLDDCGIERKGMGNPKGSSNKKIRIV